MIAIEGRGNGVSAVYPKARRLGFYEPEFLSALLARIRVFWEDVFDKRCKPPSFDDGLAEPPADRQSDSPRDDPALWMLMMH